MLNWSFKNSERGREKTKEHSDQCIWIKASKNNKKVLRPPGLHHIEELFVINQTILVFISFIKNILK